MNERILLNFLLSLAPVFGYQLLMLQGRHERNSKAAQILLGVISGVSGILCMTFPITSGTNFVWDMRWVSFILAGMYGGWRGGLMCSGIMLVYRALIGGGFLAWLDVFIDVVILLPIVLKCGRVVQSKPFRSRLIWVSIVSLACYVYIELSIFLYFVYMRKAEFFLHHGIPFFVTFGLATVVACVLCLVLIEGTFHQVEVQRKLEETEKIHLVGDLAASFAHEIRNPLTVAKGFVQLLGESLDDSLRSYSDLASSELDRAEGIISDYLNFAKPQMKSLKVLDLDATLLDLVQIMTSYAAAHNAEILYQRNRGLRIYADEQQFKQVLINVMKNAIESLPGRGTVVLESEEDQKNVRIRIQDDGVGMSEEQLKRLGKPFYSTKAKGTGIGLMTTFRLVHEMGGEIQFDSNEGTGTLCTLNFPAFASFVVS